MKSLPIAALALALALSGCSSSESEISPQEKRNRFDLCVIQWHKNKDIAIKEGGFYYDMAVKECSYLLE